MAEYIKSRKAVGLDELSAEFGLRGAEAPRRVAELEATGAITGIMDDRGKARALVMSYYSMLCRIVVITWFHPL